MVVNYTVTAALRALGFNFPWYGCAENGIDFVLKLSCFMETVAETWYKSCAGGKLRLR